MSQDEASILPPPGGAWITCADRLPPDETPVPIMLDGELRLGELRWDHPGWEDTYQSYRYWDDPHDDGQDWQMHDVTHWYDFTATAPAPLWRFTCKGKGGEYELLGLAQGAGTSKERESLAIYRDTATGALYFRLMDDFDNRMERIA